MHFINGIIPMVQTTTFLNFYNDIIVSYIIREEILQNRDHDFSTQNVFILHETIFPWKLWVIFSDCFCNIQKKMKRSGGNLLPFVIRKPIN